MLEKYIFTVGKPDLGAQSIKCIHALGYKAGLFADTATRIRHPELYDLIIPFDFSNLTQSIALIPKDITIAGLTCTYENYIPAKATIGEQCNIPTLSMKSAQLCTDKTLMREAFLAYDSTISPQFAKIESYDDAEKFVAQFGYPVIIKPAGLVKSLLVMRCNNDEELKASVETAFKNIGPLYKKYGVFGRTPKLLIEQFMTGRMYSVAGFVDKHGRLFCCDDVVELTTAQQRGVDDNYLFRRILPSGIADSQKKKLVHVANQGVKALGMSSSPAHIELIVDNDGNAKIIEIGARIGGYRPRMYEMSYGVDLLAAEIMTAAGKTPIVKGAFNAYTAVYELFPTKKAPLKGTFSNELASSFTYFSQKVKPGDIVGPSKDGFKAAAIIIVSETDPEIFHKKCQIAESLTVETL